MPPPIRPVLKAAGKRGLHAAAWLATRPAVARCRLLAPLLGRDRALTLVGESAALWPGLWGLYKRAAFYRSLLDRVGVDACIGFGSVITKRDARLHDRAYLGRFCSVGRAVLGEGAMLADHVQVLSGRHQHGDAPAAGRPLRDNPHRYDRVAVGPGAWLGASAVVMADVGDRALVAAGAVVTRPVPADRRVAGVPARPLPPAASRPPARAAA